MSDFGLDFLGELWLDTTINERRATMTDCEFCGLPTADLFWVYNVQVCFDCTDLANIAYEPEDLEIF